MTKTADANSERLELLFQVNGDALLGYLARRVEHVEDAADVLSETMLTAWRKVGKIPKSDEGARMWLFVTARNTLMNHRRTVQRRDLMSERLGLELAGVQEQSDHAEEIAELSVVRQAISSLSGELRELVTLIHWEGFSLVEAAAITGIPASTARSRYAKARSELKHAVERFTRTEA